MNGTPCRRRRHLEDLDPPHAGACLFAGLALAAVMPSQTVWLQRSPARVPAPRFGHAMADDTRGGVLLFGGNGRQDTWVWDGISWVDHVPAASPPARRYHAMASDAARQRVVLFGGENTVIVTFGDTWVWDGSNWAQQTPLTSPPARSQHAMAGDAARQRVVLFGGLGPVGIHSDTWTWDGSNWTRHLPVANPIARRYHAMAYDAARQRVVVFGGDDQMGFLADTWEWDGTTWTPQGPPTRPSARAAHAMAYDGTRQRIMMYGGDDPVGAFLADTWEWDGTNWSMRSPAAGPPDKALHAIASESSAGRLVLFGGQQQFGGYWGTNDTWLHGNLVVAAAQVFGTACAGATWLPPGLVSGVPVLGQTISLDLTTTIVSAPSMIALATNTQVVSLGGGCTLYLAGVTAPLFTLTNAFGSARVTIPIRLDPALRGLTLYAQAGVVDPTGAFSGFSLTAGLRLVLGD